MRIIKPNIFQLFCVIALLLSACHSPEDRRGINIYVLENSSNQDCVLHLKVYNEADKLLFDSSWPVLSRNRSGQSMFEVNSKINQIHTDNYKSLKVISKLISLPEFKTIDHQVSSWPGQGSALDGQGGVRVAFGFRVKEINGATRLVLDNLRN